MRSMQSGIAGKTALRDSAMAEGFPGRFIMRDIPLTPAVWRDSIAVGTFFKDTERISSPKPGSIFLHTAAVASGVMSLGAGPVPPVVMTRAHPPAPPPARARAP